MIRSLLSKPPDTLVLGRKFSLMKVSNPRIRLLALKKAEQSDEIIVRLVELDGKPQEDVKVSFATPIVSAREVNGQEQPVGAAQISGGALVTSFSAYQPRTFAIKLAPPPTKVAGVRSTPVSLKYDLAVASDDRTHSADGFDGQGNALPAEMLPAQITFDDVQFRLAPAVSGSPNAIVAKGQTLELPAGRYNRVYVLSASADGDQKASFRIGSENVDCRYLNIDDSRLGRLYRPMGRPAMGRQRHSDRGATRKNRAQ